MNTLHDERSLRPMTLTQYQQGVLAHANGVTYDELLIDTTLRWLHPEFRLGWLEANAIMIDKLCDGYIHDVTVDTL